MKLSEIVPWGRNLSEYKAMFNLDSTTAPLNILGCGDGPASFNASATELGWKVVSADPAYGFSRLQLSQRIDSIRKEVMSEIRRTEDHYVWGNIGSPDELEETRMNAMQAFLQDYEQGTQQGRYIEASLPSLPFTDKQFDLALCSHFLFLYSEQFSQQAHVDSVRELCRVAKEIRIYPLLAIDNSGVSPHLSSVINSLESDGLNAELIPVEYEFQKGATEMLKITNLQ